MSNYLGRSPTTGSYEKLDDIDSGFNGSNTAFNLTAGSSSKSFFGGHLIIE